MSEQTNTGNSRGHLKSLHFVIRQLPHTLEESARVFKVVHKAVNATVSRPQTPFCPALLCIEAHTHVSYYYGFPDGSYRFFSAPLTVPCSAAKANMRAHTHTQAPCSRDFIEISIKIWTYNKLIFPSLPLHALGFCSLF